MCHFSLPLECEPRHEKSIKCYNATHIHHTKLQYFLHWLRFGSDRTDGELNEMSPSGDIVFHHHSWSSLPICLCFFSLSSCHFSELCTMCVVCMSVSLLRKPFYYVICFQARKRSCTVYSLYTCHMVNRFNIAINNSILQIPHETASILTAQLYSMYTCVCSPLFITFFPSIFPVK